MKVFVIVMANTEWEDDVFIYGVYDSMEKSIKALNEKNYNENYDDYVGWIVEKELL